MSYDDREGHGLGYTVPQLTQALYAAVERARIAEAEVADLRARLAASEAALEQARRMLTYTLEAVVPEPCDCGDMEYCRECLAVKTIEQASAALAVSSAEVG